MCFPEKHNHCSERFRLSERCIEDKSSHIEVTNAITIMNGSTSVDSLYDQHRRAKECCVLGKLLEAHRLTTRCALVHAPQGFHSRPRTRARCGLVALIRPDESPSNIEKPVCIGSADHLLCYDPGLSLLDTLLLALLQNDLQSVWKCSELVIISLNQETFNIHVIIHIRN